MAKKQFKTESKKMLDMMINSIYTHKEIFLRELISNASDAIDKRRFKALTDVSVGDDDYKIVIERDKEKRTLTIRDNGCGMTDKELENNLGTIAKSGSGEFKENIEEPEDISVIGQFGVGFYPAFMVSDKITVKSRAIGAENAFVWESEGADGYTIGVSDYDKIGTEIVLHIKDDTENEKYGDFLEEYRIRELIRKYSDYIRYPIVTETEEEKIKEGTGEDGKDPEYETVKEMTTLNSMVPLWHKKPADVTKEQYEQFYTEKFFDYRGIAKTIHFSTEGTVSYEALLFVPKKAPYDYYTKNFEKGLQLHSCGVMITDKCKELLPDYFGFVKGMVDTSDISLNISRETLQADHQITAIAKNVEKKIKTELANMIASDREGYEAFFKEFGLQIKYGVYADYGMHKEQLKDLLMFTSSKEKKYVTLKEYTDAMPKEQKKIYYACAETADAAALLPQTEAVTAKGYEVLLLTDDVDEFALQALEKYADKEFANVSGENIDLATEEEKKAQDQYNEENKDLRAFLKDAIKDVSDVKFVNTLANHPVCLSSEGGISTEMEKVLSAMPGAEENFAPKAKTVLEINMEHPLCEKLKALYESDKDELKNCAEILYAQARLICGLPIADPAHVSALVCGLMK